MRKLLLVRHSASEVDPDVSHHEWPLSDKGRELCAPLAQHLNDLAVEVIVTSTEPKASETGEIVGKLLDLPVYTHENLHEHDRANLGYITPGTYHRQMANFFLHPNEAVFGMESAEQVYQRFNWAIGSVIQAYAGKNVAVMSHGTAISLFVSRKTDVEPLSLWQSLDSPSYVVLSLPAFTLEQVVPTLADVTESGEPDG
jgi:broad specificity phosphatase PhoE